MLLLEREGFDGMAMEEVEVCLYRGNNLQQGSRSIHMRSRNEEKLNASKNYGILTRKDLEDTKELTGCEEADKWARQPLGGVGWPHMSSSHGDFSYGNF